MRKINEELFFELVMTTKPHESLLVEYLKKNEINLSDWSIITYLYNYDHLSLNEIGELLGMDKSNVTRSVKHLVSLDIIYVTYCKEDKRKKKLNFTDKGKDLYKMIRTKIDSHEAKIVKGLTDEEIEITFNTLSKIKDNIKNLEGGIDDEQ